MFTELGSKQGDRYVRSESQKNFLRQWWSSQKDGAMFKREWKKVYPLRSNQQIKSHFGLLINTVIAEANDKGIDTSMFLKMIVQDDLPTGVGLTKDFLNELFYLLCPIYDDEGQRVTLSKMNTEQASRWFEMLRNLLASRGIVIPDPDPNWRNKQGKET